ncbi:MAG TPA: rhodanese-like domain-containing protein [Polyangiaceae bacterium]|nr:rhodanese-like domain-containing protein [Polyangiaceae bacterium]
MARVQRVSPAEAKKLLDGGYCYLDVRSVEEFGARHPAGAVNIPLTVSGDEFVETAAAFFGENAKIVVGCATGVRSQKAAKLLVEAGFSDLVDLRTGLDGARGAFGQKLEAGWAEAGFAVVEGQDDGSYEAVKAAVQRSGAAARS